LKMDVGVGSFVFSLGIISTRNFTSERQSGNSILRSARKAIPILALGMVRVIMVKGVEYPVRSAV
jgi:phosphatidylinositol glycan class W